MLLFLANFYEIIFSSIFLGKLNIEITLLSSICKIDDSHNYLIKFYYFTYPFLIFMLLFSNTIHKNKLLERLAFNISILAIFVILTILLFKNQSSFLGVIFPFNLLILTGELLFQNKLTLLVLLSVFGIINIFKNLNLKSVYRVFLILLGMIFYYTTISIVRS